MTDRETDRIVEVRGRGSIWVRDIPGPRPDSPAVLLLHGLGATARLNWGACFRPLSRHFRVLALDHRGHGRGLRTRRFRLEECADDAILAMQALEIPRVHLVGYSMGGPIASLAWQRHGEHVSGLVLCATARHFARRHVGHVSRTFLPMAAHGARLFPDAAHRYLLGRMLGRVENESFRRRILAELSGHDPATIMEAAGAVGGFSSHGWIGEVDVPTAVIVTTEDELVPPDRQRKLAAAIPDARVYEVAGNHAACVAAAGSFAPSLVDACRFVSSPARDELRAS